jgi:cytochrome c peroxidase
VNLENMGLKNGVKRTPDALLYALALFIESLQPPPNPNRPNAESERGHAVFQAQGCDGCHSAPLYTNNRLTLALTYHPSESIGKLPGVMNISVGTDPNLALKTRKGTGFYRVPSLRMVWMEACLLHDGSIGSLEEMFNPARLKPDFRSSNWAPITKAHAVQGHPFGLELAPADRAALISFLRTL